MTIYIEVSQFGIFVPKPTYLFVDHSFFDVFRHFGFKKTLIYFCLSCIKQSEANLRAIF